MFWLTFFIKKHNEGYFAAIIGRNPNRIKKSEFELNGKVYKLFRNDGENNLYGGKTGFDKRLAILKKGEKYDTVTVYKFI